MKPLPPHPRPFAFTGSTSARLDDIEWEELPSLVGRLHAATANAEPAPAWEVTMPAALDAGLPPEPFSEAMQGLAVREVREPDVFRHFFGPGRGAGVTSR